MKAHITTALLLSILAKTRALPSKDSFPTEDELRATEGRIIGGSPASPGEYPFFVRWDGCGASLIHGDILLSAAHCNPISSNSVYVGSRNRYGSDPGAEFRTITHRVVHPLYNSNTIENDFMVMKISSASTHTPIPLNENANEPVDDETLTAIGFGLTSNGGFSSNVLMEVDLNYLDSCATQWGSFYVPEVMLCAGVPGGGKSACNGDSGGPIFDSAGVQVGVASFVNGEAGCAHADYYTVFARVSSATDWIKQQICQLSDNPPSDCPGGSGTGGSGTATGSPGPGEARVRIDFTYDNWPSETSWSLSGPGGTIVDSYAQGTLSESGLVSYNYNLSGGSYSMQVGDSFGDGICCSYGSGSILIVQEATGGDNTLVYDDGTSWDSSVTHTFTVTPAGGGSSGGTGGGSGGFTCEDSSRGTFSVGGSIGDEDCAWLGNNLVRYGYLCTFTNVALMCPVTCDICDLI